MVILYLVDKDLLGLSIRPSRFKEDHDERMIFISIKSKNSPVSALSFMEYVQVLYSFLRKVDMEDPDLGPMYALKVDVSNSFYPKGLRLEDNPKLGLIFLLE